jgi:membrane-associated HD superfamily phosphohydrolase
MIVLYALSGMAPSDVSYPQVIYNGSEEITVKGEIIRAVMRVTHSLLFVIIVYSPLLLTFLISRKETKNTEVNLPLFFVTTSLIVPVLSRAILIGFDSAQFLTYLLPAFTIFLLFVILKFIVYHKNKIWKRTLTITILLVLISTNAYYLTENNRSKNKVYNEIYSDEYVKNVKLALSKPEQVKKIGYVLSQELLHTNMPSNWNIKK